MTKPPDPFHEFVIELFEPLGPVRVKRMFGGAGVFAGDVMFALLAEDVIYIKTDESLRADLEAEGSEPFLYERPSDGKSFDMGYVSLPSGAMDEAEEASAWGRRALDVALKAAKTKKPRKAKKA
ncbi:MAG: TfoX/Sxy family protein [Pseudomonadota bacterium]